jgi:alkylhydroperoxidase/carboxymuconolactone decarboxylase family protein YurZ
VPESYLKGLEEISAIDPESGPAFVEELKKISADFAEYYVAFAFGQIHARQIFEPKLKELIAIASLISLGDGKSHLRLRIQGACRAVARWRRLSKSSFKASSTSASRKH